MVKSRFFLANMVGAAILLRSLAAVCAKMAAIHSTGKGLQHIVFNFWTGAELATLVLQAVLWSHVLNRFPLNKVYPATSLVFGVNLAAAAVIFQETVRTNHIIGIAIVIIGIVIVNTPDKVATVSPR